MTQTMKKNDGFTLIEMLVAISMVGIVTIAVGALLSGGQRNWNRLYGRVYGDPAIDGFAVQQVFDSICRKSSMRKCQIGPDGESLELYYGGPDSTAAQPENYARFYLADGDVYVEHGTLTDGTWQPESMTSRIKVARGVESLKFDVRGISVQIYVTYQDERTLPIACSTVRHND